jgi:hypothetical protein
MGQFPAAFSIFRTFRYSIFYILHSRASCPGVSPSHRGFQVVYLPGGPRFLKRDSSASGSFLSFSIDKEKYHDSEQTFFSTAKVLPTPARRSSSGDCSRGQRSNDASAGEHQTIPGNHTSHGIRQREDQLIIDRKKRSIFPVSNSAKEARDGWKWKRRLRQFT